MDDTKVPQSPSNGRKRASARKPSGNGTSRPEAPTREVAPSEHPAANRLRGDRGRTRSTSPADLEVAAPKPARRNGRGRGARASTPRGQGRGGHPLQPLLAALRSVHGGDFSVRLPGGDADPVMEEIATAFNAVVSLNATLTQEVVRVERVVGREGRMGERVSLGDVRGDWAHSINSINSLIGDLVQPTTEVARVLDRKSVV